MKIKVLAVVCFTFCLTELQAQQPTAQLAKSELLFARRVSTLLREKCLACHGGKPDAIEGALDLRTLKSVRKGGESGKPAVVSGKPNASPLYLAARRDHDDWSAMPPKEAEKLSDKQLSWLREWIATGAAWPNAKRLREIEKKYADQWSKEDGIPVKTSGGLSAEWTNRKYDPAGLWAYRPVKPISISPKELAARNPIDVLLQRSMPKGLRVAPAAARAILIRRATFDLTGLPPTPEEVRNFINDKRDDRLAFADVVDRLLKSPHYGERMAQHWLDVVRYADSSGFANDYQRGNAWRYRDYVVRSFNNDKPYDQFVREQIAGDELRPDDPEALIAVGFLRMGPWELTGMEVARVARQRFLDDVTNSVGETFLGHSLQCARCHDHKFDPVPTRDYYSIQAVFATTQLAERATPFLKIENQNGFDEVKFLHQRRKEHIATLAKLHDVLLKNAQQWFAVHPESPHKAAWDMAIAKAQKEKRAEPFNVVRGQFRNRGVPQGQYPPKLVGFTPRQHGMNRVARKGLSRLSWEFDRYRPFALSVYNGHTPSYRNVQSPLRIPKNRRAGTPESSHILTGGSPFALGAAVQPDTLSVIDNLVSAKIPTTLEGRRSRFARWVADAKNPLTSRVIVNRIWQWHLGKAIAGNPNNFGSTGRRPTHPELLDFLAGSFVHDGWSFKKLHRRIMLSDAYRRSSSHPDPVKLKSLDPQRQLYAVFQPRRLTAEELRDAMLAVTGELNPVLGGIPCRPEINKEVAMQPRQVMGTFAEAWLPNPKPQQRHRRSLYVLKLRGVMHPMLEVFNAPSSDFSCERREASTVTPQVFSLFNGQDTWSRALVLADRVSRETRTLPIEKRDAAAVSRCFELAYGRRPTARQLQMFLAHWKKIEGLIPAEAPKSRPAPKEVVRTAVEENTGERFTFVEKLFSNEHFVPDLQPSAVSRHTRALADLCVVILNSNEFVFIY